MSRRTQRVANLIRRILGEALLSKLSDPRIDSARTSVTRVEVPEDLLTARVFVSVLGTQAQQRKVLRALQHAAGRLQELMMKQISLRHTPILSFDLDTRYKKTLQTLDIIRRAMDEIHERELARQEKPDAPVGVDEPQQHNQPVPKVNAEP
ncbi:MAG: 30S ribosome-binding factor RbfA [Phycisphaerae bacterium]